MHSLFCKYRTSDLALRGDEVEFSGGDYVFDISQEAKVASGRR